MGQSIMNINYCKMVSTLLQEVQNKMYIIGHCVIYTFILLFVK